MEGCAAAVEKLALLQLLQEEEGDFQNSNGCFKNVYL